MRPCLNINRIGHVVDAIARLRGKPLRQPPFVMA